MPIRSSDFTSEQRNLLALAARTESGNSTPIEIAVFNHLQAILTITASATEAGDTLDVFVDISYDAGATWLNVIHFPQQAGNGAARTSLASVDGQGSATTINVTANAAADAVRREFIGAPGARLRARWTIVDVVTTGNVSHTFGVTVVAG